MMSTEMAPWVLGGVVTVDVSAAVAELLGLPTSVTLALTTSTTLVPAGGEVPLNSHVTDSPAPISWLMRFGQTLATWAPMVSVIDAMTTGTVLVFLRTA